MNEGSKHQALYHAHSAVLPSYMALVHYPVAVSESKTDVAPSGIHSLFRNVVQVSPVIVAAINY